MSVIKSVCSARACNLLRTHTQSDTKLCEQLLFYFYPMSFIYEENMKKYHELYSSGPNIPQQSISLFSGYDRVIVIS